MAVVWKSRQLLFFTAVSLWLVCGAGAAHPSPAEEALEDRIQAGIVGEECLDRCDARDESNVTMCACRPPEECALRGDCCADRYYAEQERPNLQCVPAFNREIVAVALCPSSWKEPKTLLLCEGVQNKNYTYLQYIPVLSRKSKQVYRNVFCASCNGDTSDLLPWTLSLECESKEVTQAFSDGTAQKEAIMTYSTNSRFLFVSWKNHSTRCRILAHELLPQNYSDVLGLTPCVIQPIVWTCPASFDDPVIRSKCHSYTSLIEHSKTQLRYRNFHCALCNGRKPKDLRCGFLEPRGSEVKIHGYMSYAIVMDFSNWMGAGDSDDRREMASAPRFNRCGREQVFDPLTLTCHHSSCPPDVCHTKDCEWTRFSRDDIVPSDHGKFFRIPKMELTLDISDMQGDKLSEDHVLVCLPLPRMSALRPTAGIQDVLSTVVLLISVICLVLHVAAYALAPKLRTGPSRLLLCLAVSVLVAQASFVAGGMLFMPNTKLCAALGIVSHGGHLAAFFWMNAMAVDIQRTFRAGIRGSSRAGSWRSFLGYSLYAWLGPVLLVASASLLDHLLPQSPLSPAYGRPSCWLNRPLSLAAFFGAPVLLLLLTNLVLFALTAHSIQRTEQQTKVAHRQSRRQGDQVRFVLYVKLAVMFGLTWVFGFAAAISGISFLWFPFIVLCGLHGAFIFLAFTFKKSVANMVLETLKCRDKTRDKRRPRSASTNLTTLHASLSASSSALASVATGRAMPDAPRRSLPQAFIDAQRPLLPKA
ncbi:uncharacterized protein LOC8039131 [Ixodes scapularis]|uniref:uncharacterized protein LOC8039131 n=1 Tax=Ixodes scapularis TaxID=6945 RepID=UPI001C395652|nr:uncharacterized protein LOC8039131 [Ixodes scapularis]